jgi:hypothetical protein
MAKVGTSNPDRTISLKSCVVENDNNLHIYIFIFYIHGSVHRKNILIYINKKGPGVA